MRGEYLRSMRKEVMECCIRILSLLAIVNILWGFYRRSKSPSLSDEVGLF